MNDSGPTGEDAAGSLPPALFVFAAAGVCLGLNDVWRFPHLVMEHGSVWFPALYLAGILLIGLPLLVAELTLARLGHGHPSRNFGFIVEAPEASRLWQYVGLIILVTVFLILCYTTVVASWMIAYAVRALSGGLEDISLGVARLMFHSLITDPERLLGWHTLFVLALAWVAGRGVKEGVGRVSGALVIISFALAAALAAVSLLAYDAEPAGAVRSLAVSVPSGALVVDAVTQSFFTLGVCMGAMLILGTYLPSRARVGTLVSSVVALDVLFVALACAAVLPTLGAGEAAGREGVVYAMETVPLLLAAAPLGRVYLVAFYVLLLMLVVTTAVVLMELPVAWLTHKTGKTRRAVLPAVAAVVWAGGLLALLSFSVLSFDFEFVGEAKNFGLFDLMDVASSRILLPIIGLLMTVFIGWRITRKEFQSATGWNLAASVLHHLKRYWVPAALAAIFAILVFGRVLGNV